MRKRFISLLAVCLLAACLLAGCARTNVGAEMEKRTAYFFGTFDTVVTVIAYTREQATFDQYVEKIKERFGELYRLYDAYNAYEGIENIHTLNRDAGKGPVKVEPELMDMLLFAREWQPKLHDTVNIALGSVLAIWHDYRERGMADEENAALPPMELLRGAAEHTDFDAVELDPEAGTVRFKDPALRLDVGAIAKGYATELVAQWLLTSDMPHFILNAGGNVRTGLPPLDGRENWGVSLQNPDAALAPDNPEQSIDVLYVSDISVVTSGDYQRFYRVDGVRYHHIISPDTLFPANEHRAVTIVCRDSGLADILSTAVFILPYEEGRALVESLDGVEALWVGLDGRVLMTDGLAPHSKKQLEDSR